MISNSIKSGLLYPGPGVCAAWIDCPGNHFGNCPDILNHSGRNPGAGNRGDGDGGNYRILPGANDNVDWCGGRVVVVPGGHSGNGIDW